MSSQSIIPHDRCKMVHERDEPASSNSAVIHEPRSVSRTHHPAAFINAIAEEGTKAEAVEWLQRQWNENCELRKLNAEMLDALRDAELQIDYLSVKFQRTGSGEAILARTRAAIAKAEGKP